MTDKTEEALERSMHHKYVLLEWAARGKRATVAVIDRLLSVSSGRRPGHVKIRVARDLSSGGEPDIWIDEETGSKHFIPGLENQRPIW